MKVNPALVNLAFWIVVAIGLVIVFNVWPSLPGPPWWAWPVVIVSGWVLGWIWSKRRSPNDEA
jgi:hypothetical protein